MFFIIQCMYWKLTCSPVIIHYTNQHSEGEGKQLPGISAQTTSHCTFGASNGEDVETQEGLRTREMQVGALCQSLQENFILCCEKSNGMEHKCRNGQEYGDCVEWGEELGCVYVHCDALVLQWNFKEFIHLNVGFAAFPPPSGYPGDAFCFSIFSDPLILGNTSSQ